MRRKLICLMLILGSKLSFSQRYDIYSDDTLRFNSPNLQESILLNLHLPETFKYASKDTKFPVFIIFDSQHQNTYPSLIKALDMLTNDAQIPEAIVVGIPFNYKNRFYLTSHQKQKGDSLSGIERMDKFIFSELLPSIHNQYKGNDFLCLIGHSRTAYLVNYLAYTHPSETRIAISTSGFFDQENITLEKFASFLTDSNNFAKKFQYYYSAGTTREEASYFSPYSSLDSLLNLKPKPQQVETKFFPVEYANHISNYWMSVPLAIIQGFQKYNELFDIWLHEKMNAPMDEVDLKNYKNDLEKLGKELNTTFNPSVTHIYSFASYLLNSKKDPEIAIEFFELGLQYYPEFYEFYIEIIDLYKAQKDKENMQAYAIKLQDLLLTSKVLDEVQKKEIMQYLHEL